MITLLHLTDLHFRENNNPVLTKKNAFYSAINSVIQDSDYIFVCVTGDIAFSGKATEYALALDFFEDLRNSIMKKSNIKIKYLFVPGNHDCDFSNKDNEEFRNILIEAIRSGKRDRKTTSQIDLQSNYREFVEMFDEEFVGAEIKFLNNDLFCSVDIKIDTEEIIFNLFNTSWISTLHEQPGKMIYPIDDELTKHLQNKKGSINVSMIHHPSNWLEPNNASELKELLKKSSDFILSGHEHTSSDTDSFDRVNRDFISSYEGGLFQDIEQPDKSEFNIIHLDLKNKIKKDLKYSWNERIYEKTFDSEWIPLATNENKSNLYFKKEFSKTLKEYSVPITHPRMDFDIDTLFIYPDVKEILLQEKNSELLELENSFDILDGLKPGNHLHFYGDKESGKTSLAKKCYIELINNGKYPLLASGVQVKPNTHSEVEKFIRKTTDLQYENSTEQYIQLNKEERVLIIDDWDQCGINEDTQNKTLKQLSKWFDNIIILSAAKFNDFKNIKLAITHNNENTFVYRQFEIEKLGHFKRNELIGKWIKLGQESTLEAEEYIRKQDEYERSLNTIIGNNFVPSTPLMILVLLSTLETTEPHKMGNSTNGYYYEILIKQTLSKMQIKYDDTNKLYNYLTELAYEVYKSSNQIITLDQWMNYHKAYQREYALDDIQLNFVELRSSLINAKVIKYMNSEFMFSYSYIYYYFVAQYLADNLHEENSSQSTIAFLCENLHIETNSNILMFLTHLSKDKIIINLVLDSARKLFKDSSLLKIEEDMEPLNKLFLDIPDNLIVEDSDVEDNRKQQHLDRDHNERINGDENIESLVDEDTLRMLHELNKSQRTLEILGLILKNYYGSKSANEKNEIGTEALSVALRTGNIMTESLIQDQENITLFIEHLIRENGLSTDEKQIKKISTRVLYNLIRRLTLSTIGRVTLTLGSKNLISIFDSVAADPKINNITSVRLIQVAIKLEYRKEFPYREVEELYKDLNNNIIGKDLLKMIVQRYLYMFPTNQSQKQRICALVNLRQNSSFLLKHGQAIKS